MREACRPFASFDRPVHSLKTDLSKGNRLTPIRATKPETRHSLAALAAFATLTAAPVSAQNTVLVGTHVITGDLCAGTDFFLKVGTMGSQSNAKTKVFTVKNNGDAIVFGTLTTGGTACGGGCDRVFTDHQIIPAAEYASQMWSQGHLPHVGPTPEGAPLNVSEKLGGMLNALEHAHVFIDRQASEIAAQRGQIEMLTAQKSALETRLARVEDTLAALAARLPD